MKIDRNEVRSHVTPDRSRPIAFEQTIAPVKVPHLASPSRNATTGLDDQILKKVQHVLHHSGYEQLRRVRTFCRHGRIVLQGRISTYYLKQVAQELVRNVSEVHDIDNDLLVVCCQ